MVAVSAVTVMTPPSSAIKYSKQHSPDIRAKARLRIGYDVKVLSTIPPGGGKSSGCGYYEELYKYKDI